MEAKGKKINILKDVNMVNQEHILVVATHRPVDSNGGNQLELLWAWEPINSSRLLQVSEGKIS